MRVHIEQQLMDKLWAGVGKQGGSPRKALRERINGSSGAEVESTTPEDAARLALAPAEADTEAAQV